MVANSKILREQVEAGIWNAGVILPSAVISGSDAPPKITMLGPVQRPQTMLTFAQLERILRGTLGPTGPLSTPIPRLRLGRGWPDGPPNNVRPVCSGLVGVCYHHADFFFSIGLSREIERGTLLRLQLTPIKPWHLVAGMGMVQAALGIICVAITLVTAIVLGFSVEGSLLTALLFITLGCVSSIGIGLVIACLMKTTPRCFLVSSFVMFLLLVFSGIVFPQPEGILTTVMNQAVSWTDFLPTSHLRVALDRILAVAGTSPGSPTNCFG